MRRLFAIIVAAIAFVGCSMDDITVSYQTDKSDIYYASFEDFGEESRTYVDENVKLLWHEDDRISLFRTTLNEQFKFTGTTGDNSGGFSAIPSDEWVTGNVVSTNYAVYPYDATTKLSNDEIIQLTMPAVQHYAENSFGRGANTMVAASENTSSKFLPFRNLGGYIIVKLYGEDTTIKSIEFKGNNDEIIAGAATAEAKYGYLPVVTMLESGTTTITLDCGEEGVTISSDSANPTSFWFVVPPITFEGGFTFTITDINGNTFTKSTTKSQTVVRNEVKSMSGFEPTFEGEGEDPEVATKPANNEIWYTNGSTTEATVPYATDVFAANIVSNTYDADKECWVIKFDEEVTEIGDLAFYNCTSLKNITIPNSVTNIGYRAFSGCTSLKSIIIPESVKEIEGGTFRDCSSLTNVTIPDSVTNIGDLAFSECTSLTNMTIPDSVTSIGNSAFFGCTSLTSVNIPDSVTTIGGAAFQGCFLLKSITIPNSITTIEDYTFYGCSFTSVTIPDSVTEIKRNPFSYCKNLAKFEGKYAANNGRCLIKDNVIISYANASGAEYTIHDSVTSIGNSAFFGCTSLTSVNIPDSVTTIEGDAFRFCTSLTNVTIPDSVTTIESSTFESCSSLTSVTIPDSVTTIRGTAFRFCTSLTSVTIGNSVTLIGDSAFLGCTSLTSVTIPDSVTTIGGSAFKNCTSLKEVYCKATTPPIGYMNMFNSNASGRKIYVPSASVSAYKSATYWSTYSSDIIGYDF
ncbi:MAG: leucine-rich repeat protein [Alistipes sp.]|nr:leucine-rich repeat protein [Alistipes sp.]